jgi:transcription initiation factor IIE alpha subunit
MDTCRVSPQECDLALSQVEEYFGDAVAKVARTVVQHGHVTLESVTRHSGLPLAVVKHCLIILIKHNFVISYKNDPIKYEKQQRQQVVVKGDGDAGGAFPRKQQRRKQRKNFIYIADPSYMLSLLKFPSWMLAVKSTMGEEAEVIIEALINHGRLSQADVYKVAADKLKRPLEEVKEGLKGKFCLLVDEKYVERAPEGRLLPPWFETLDENVKRGHKGLKDELDEMKNAQQAANVMYTKSKRDRFLVDNSEDEENFTDDSSEEEEEEEEEPNVLGGSHSHYKNHSKSNGIKVKHENGINESSPVGIGKRKFPSSPSSLVHQPRRKKKRQVEVMWRVNMQEFNERSREKLCLELVEVGLKGLESKAFRGVIAAYRKKRHFRDDKSDGDKSENLTLAEICRATDKAEGQGQDEFEFEIRSALNELKRYQMTDLIIPVAGHEDSDNEDSDPLPHAFNFKMGKLSELLQLSKIDGIVEEKFGVHAKRVFRLLRKQKSLEEKDIAIKAMLQPKATREILYKLFRAHYVHMYEVPKEPSHMASRTFFMWHIEQKLLLSKCKTDVYETLLNIQQKLRFENNASKDVQDLIEKRMTESRAQQSQDGIIEDILANDCSDEQRERFYKSQKNVPILESCLVHLSTLMTIFSL